MTRFFSYIFVFTVAACLVWGCATGAGNVICENDHCDNGLQDCDETDVDCGGADCIVCGCVPDCTGYSCGQTEPACGSVCGDACDAGCDHCANGVQDCDETDVDCGGVDCIVCGCVPDCTGYSCGQTEPTCGTMCGDACDAGCTDHCANGVQDCDETDVDCGGADCIVCGCVPDCTGYSCGQTEPTCGTTCGNACDAGCTGHCSNGLQDCDETGVDCGGAVCAACTCIPDCTGYSCGQTEPTCGTTCGNACDPGCTGHCSNGLQDCDETGVDCGGAACAACTCIPDCTGYSCGQTEPTCGTTCGTACDAGCTGHCSNGFQDCDETGVDCGGTACSACSTGCGTICYHYDGSCSSSFIGACDGCDMGCEVHDPDCDDPGSTCLSSCPCLFGNSHWYCDGWDDCTDINCECAGDNPCIPDCTGYSCGQTEPTCGTTCGDACDPGCTAHCSNGFQDCDEAGVDCGGSACSACCGTTCFHWSGSCSSSFIGACDGCDMGCEVHDPDCDSPGSTCLSSCPCLAGYSHWYCDGWDDCTDPSCECAGE